ncbi:MAG TPA: hypothetical protein VFU47_12620, partial [Armatimonadota bacterium]|nr:hypothetical protein [Armatimonadota bacterium]
LALALLERSEPAARPRRLILFAVPALAVGALAFLPVLLRHGLGFFRYFYSGYPDLGLLVSRATIEVWGLLGVAAFVLAVLWGAVARSTGRGGPAAVPRGGGLSIAGWLGALALWLFAYLRLPYEAAYLIPAMPFALLLLGRWLPRAPFRMLCSVLCCAALIGGMPQGPRYNRAAGWQQVEQPALFDFFRGPVFQRHDGRMVSVLYAEHLVWVAQRLPRPSIIVCESWEPYVRAYIPSGRINNTEFVYLVTPQEAVDYRNRGYDVYFTPLGWDAAMRIHHVDLRQFGAQPVP